MTEEYLESASSPGNAESASDDLHEGIESRDIEPHKDVLPDGRETFVYGDPEGCKEFNHLQGQNELGFQGTCGLVSCQDVLLQHGIEVTENDVVKFAAEHGLCAVSDDPRYAGGTSEYGQMEILHDFGVEADVRIGASVENLASAIEQGHSVIAEMNAGVLWNDPSYYENGEANHAIVVTGVARDPATNEIQAFYINDSGTGQSDRLVDVKTVQEAWLGPSGVGVSVVTKDS